MEAVNKFSEKIAPGPTHQLRWTMPCAVCIDNQPDGNTFHNVNDVGPGTLVSGSRISDVSVCNFIDLPAPSGIFLFQNFF